MSNFSFWGLCVICSSSFSVSVYVVVVIFGVNESMEVMSSYIPPAIVVSMGVVSSSGKGSCPIFHGF